MEFNLEKFVRPHLLDLKSYETARPSVLSPEQFYLDANESPYGNYNRYPDSEHILLREKLAEINAVKKENIFLGNGSDELIDLVLRIFCEPGKDSVMFFDPSFSMYEVYASLNNVRVEKLSLDSEFQINKELFDKACGSTNSKLLFLCSPNNPTGNSINNLEYFIQSFPGIVVVDEAYIEFSPRPSAVQLLDKYPNLIVFKTLSKAYGMAGLRIGIGLASPEIAALFYRCKPPYNISAESERLALLQVQNSELLKENLEKILFEKEILREGLSEISEVINVFPSDANFFLVEFSDAVEMYEMLFKAGILTAIKHPKLQNCIRISVGNADENSKLLNLLSAYKS